ncbi:hypothetical protein ACFLZF_00195 [Nanoarchaeota archaeon]
MKELNKKAQSKKVIFFSSFLIILIVAIYFTFYYFHSCENMECFRAYQMECAKSEFVNDMGDITWGYTILGRTNGACEIKIKVLKVKQGDLEKKRIEGKDMSCYLALGDDSLPESNLANCHGLLKEELQKIMIEKLHLYIIENIGEIGKELQKAI